MLVSVLFSGGKDSVFAAQRCIERGWQIETLIAVKPHSDEAYLWHYPTVEWTPLIAKAMNLPLTLLECGEIGADAEAAVLEKILPQLKCDALVLGGVGLQETQVRKIKETAKKHGKKVVLPCGRYSSEQLLLEELESGMEIVITETAAGGLTKEFLGRKIAEEDFDDFVALARKHGFDVLGEGGAYNTFVTDAPFFSKKIFLGSPEIVWDAKTRSGHLVVKNAFLLDKAIIRLP